MSSPLRILAYAKINLQLGVIGRRSDGYHELRTVFQAISLHDVLSLERARRSGIDLLISGAALDPGPSNLIWRALDGLSAELGLGGGWRVRLEKRIPMGAGLGGGSSDAAAALRGGLRLAGHPLDAERLLALAASLGADVPFFLLGGCALGAGRGDEVYPLADGPRQAVLVVAPRGIQVSTREAYAWLDRRLTKPPAPPRLFVSCARSWNLAETCLENDFEAAVFRRHPRLRRIKNRLLDTGAAGAALAGSGSAVFALFRNPAQARRAAGLFPEDRTFVARTLTRAECFRQAKGQGRA